MKNLVVKSPKVISPQPVMESFTPTIPQPSPTTPIMSSQEKRDAYKNILGETAASFNSSQAPTFQPNPGMDVANVTPIILEVQPTKTKALKYHHSIYMLCTPQFLQ